MHAGTEQGEPDPEIAQETQAAQELTAEVGVAARARTQAARVRESLVRCPGVEGQRAA
jgi:hypothetical protein